MAQADHRGDVAALSPRVAAAVRSVVKQQHTAARSAAAAGGKPVFDHKAETAKLKAAVLPGFVAAVHVGAKRAAKAAGAGTPSPDTNLAGAWAYKFATQWQTTTAGQVAELTTGTGTAATAAVDHLFDIRTGLAAAAASVVISNAINSGGVHYANGQTVPLDKTWSVTDGNPCPACTEATGQSVATTADFANGAPHGPIHAGCMCSVTFTPRT